MRKSILLLPVIIIAVCFPFRNVPIFSPNPGAHPNQIMDVSRDSERVVPATGAPGSRIRVDEFGYPIPSATREVRGGVAGYAFEAPPSRNPLARVLTRALPRRRLWVRDDRRETAGDALLIRLEDNRFVYVLVDGRR